jgi:CO/xanthine dehydrogenase FAD-binding subunit
MPRAAMEAEHFLAGGVEEAGAWDAPRALPETLVGRFAELVAGAAEPIDDVRGSAAYRRHALAVMARRTLTWAWDEYRQGVPA